jgi:hypothetical protein
VATVLAHMSAFTRANQAWWNQGYIARAFRFVGWGAGWASSIDIE